MIREKLSQGKMIERNKVVIAPTWRRHLRYKPGTINEQPREYLLESRYYEYYSEILNSDEMKSLSKKYEIVLIPHPEMLYRIDEFKVPGYIKIKTYKQLGTKKLYDLALEAKLFVTDFSSTAFDFAFLGANVVYFNFDAEDYYSDKQELYKSWFDIEKDGFGPSFQEVGQLKKYIIGDEWIRYQENIDKVWHQIPDNSCELIYQNIKKIVRS
ncbi:CDP-Glycerol:Poly(glycerophosphate) glycerophosphotransferase [compost metagenome]